MFYYRGQLLSLFHFSLYLQEQQIFTKYIMSRHCFKSGKSHKIIKHEKLKSFKN